MELGRGLAALGFTLCATGGTAWALAAAGLKVDGIRKVTEPGGRAHGGRPDSPPARRGLAVVNTPDGRGARSDGYLIREAALVARALCDDDRGRRGGRRGHRTRDPRRDPLLQERVARPA